MMTYAEFLPSLLIRQHVVQSNSDSCIYFVDECMLEVVGVLSVPRCSPYYLRCFQSILLPLPPTSAAMLFFGGLETDPPVTEMDAHKLEALIFHFVLTADVWGTVFKAVR